MTCRRKTVACPTLIGMYFETVTEPAITAAEAEGRTHTLKCGHPWDRGRTRPHVGDVVCHICGRQDHVYDRAFYDAVEHIPEPGKRGSLQPEPQSK